MSATVRDVMTAPVITIQQDTPFQAIAEMLTAYQIAALPVLDPAGKLVGVVSETDLLFKEANPHAGTNAPLLERRRSRLQREKAVATTAAELMTTPPVTIQAAAPLTEAAKLMHARKVHHLPVVDAQGALVGIISRSDLLRVYVRRDETIRQDVIANVIVAKYVALALETRTVEQINVEVNLGVVTLSGKIERKSLIEVLRRMAQEVDGVVGVDTDLEADIDDTDIHAGAFPYPLYRS